MPLETTTEVLLKRQAGGGGTSMLGNNVHSYTKLITKRSDPITYLTEKIKVSDQKLCAQLRPLSRH